jgi:hypothetical protein
MNNKRKRKKKDQLIPILLKLLEKIEGYRTLLMSFYMSFYSIPKTHKDTAGKENYKPISLMNINIKILNKISAN